jgi:hypothetical protein
MRWPAGGTSEKRTRAGLSVSGSTGRRPPDSARPGRGAARRRRQVRVAVAVVPDGDPQAEQLYADYLAEREREEGR